MQFIAESIASCCGPAAALVSFFLTGADWTPRLLGATLVGGATPRLCPHTHAHSSARFRSGRVRSAPSHPAVRPSNRRAGLCLQFLTVPVLMFGFRDIPLPATPDHSGDSVASQAGSQSDLRELLLKEEDEEGGESWQQAPVPVPAPLPSLGPSEASGSQRTHGGSAASPSVRFRDSATGPEDAVEVSGEAPVQDSAPSPAPVSAFSTRTSRRASVPWSDLLPPSRQASSGDWRSAPGGAAAAAREEENAEDRGTYDALVAAAAAAVAEGSGRLEGLAEGADAPASASTSAVAEAGGSSHGRAARRGSRQVSRGRSSVRVRTDEADGPVPEGFASEASLSGWVDAPVPIGHRVESLIGWRGFGDPPQIAEAPESQTSSDAGQAGFTIGDPPHPAGTGRGADGSPHRAPRPLSRGPGHRGGRSRSPSPIVLAREPQQPHTHVLSLPPLRQSESADGDDYPEVEWLGLTPRVGAPRPVAATSATAASAVITSGINPRSPLSRCTRSLLSPPALPPSFPSPPPSRRSACFPPRWRARRSARRGPEREIRPIVPRAPLRLLADHGAGDLHGGGGAGGVLRSGRVRGRVLRRHGQGARGRASDEPHVIPQGGACAEKS